MQDFDNKVAVITGGASGIGFATASKLGARGVDLLLADIEPDALDEAAAVLRTRHGVRVEGQVCNVALKADVDALAEFAFAEMGGAHILFNNAGVAVGGPVAEMSYDDWRWIIDVDLWGVINGVHAFLPRIQAQGQPGHILFTASFAGLVPNVGLGPYCVAKYGVVALAEVLAKELRGSEIGVSVLCPMRVGTNIGDSQRNRDAIYGGGEDTAAVADQDESNEDMAGRVLDVDDVAALVVEAIEANELYILPHPESRESIQRRFARIDATFERQRVL
jgi:NAD(P)-dependent dehydrogenase (short-subunit alcohol dehydrogenase family)